MESGAEVLVVGAGWAGLAAAYAARRLGVAVHVAHDRAGASAFSCGAHDLAGGAHDAGEVPASVRSFLEETHAPIVLGDARVVSAHGHVRHTRGRDAQVLALPSTKNQPILVPRVPVGSWDSDAIAASLREQGEAAVAVDATLLRTIDEQRMPLADVAGLHDDGERQRWLIERLRELLARHDETRAILLPPMLGIAPTTMQSIAKAVPIPIGEALGEPGGPAAIRFSAYRARVLAESGASIESCVVLQVSRQGAMLGCSAPSKSARKAAAVVLASGGMIGGGLSYRTAEHEMTAELPAAASGPFHERPSIHASGDEDVVVPYLRGAPLDPASSLFGPDPEALVLGADPAVLSVGLAVDDEQRVIDRAGRALRWLFAAGDVVAGAPRTTLTAIASGAAAGAAAAARAANSHE